MPQRSGYDAWTRWWQKVRKGVYRPVLTSGRISCLTWSMFEHLSAVRTGRAIAFLAPPCDRDTNCACPRLTSLVGIHLLLKLRQSHTSATLPGDSAALLLMFCLRPGLTRTLNFSLSWAPSLPCACLLIVPFALSSGSAPRSPRKSSSCGIEVSAGWGPLGFKL